MCQPNGTGVDVCGPLAGTGERCGQCKFDLRCAITDGGSVGTCATKGTLGDSCRQPSDCARGFFCQPAGSNPFGPGTCAARLNVAAPCATDFDCKPMLFCDSRAPTDGGFFPERRCAAGDGGLGVGCIDRTP